MGQSPVFVWSTIHILMKGQCKQHHTDISLFKFLSNFCLVSKLIFYSRGHILFTLSLEIWNTCIYSVPFSLYDKSAVSEAGIDCISVDTLYYTKWKKNLWFTLFSFFFLQWNDPFELWWSHINAYCLGMKFCSLLDW